MEMTANLYTEICLAHQNEKILPVGSQITYKLVHSVRCTPSTSRSVKDFVPTIHCHLEYKGVVLCKKNG